MIKYICDICKKDFSQSLYYYKIKIYFGADLISTIRVGDVCKECRNKIIEDIFKLSQKLKDKYNIKKED